MHFFLELLVFLQVLMAKKIRKQSSKNDREATPRNRLYGMPAALVPFILPFFYRPNWHMDTASRFDYGVHWPHSNDQRRCCIVRLLPMWRGVGIFSTNCVDFVALRNEFLLTLMLAVTVQRSHSEVGCRVVLFKLRWRRLVYTKKFFSRKL